MSTNVILVVTSAISELERHIKWVGTWKFGIKGRAHTGLGAFVDMENYAGLNIQISARVTIKNKTLKIPSIRLTKMFPAGIKIDVKG